MLDAFAHVERLLLPSNTEELSVSERWIDACERKGVACVGAEELDNRSRKVTSLSLTRAMNFCFGTKPSRTRKLVGDFGWDGEAPFLHRLVQVMLFSVTI